VAASGQAPAGEGESAAGEHAHRVGLAAENLGDLARLAPEAEAQPENHDGAGRQVRGEREQIADRILMLLRRGLARRHHAGQELQQAALARLPTPVLKDLEAQDAEQPGFLADDAVHGLLEQSEERALHQVV
jgi:hypothetical protein